MGDANYITHLLLLVAAYLTWHYFWRFRSLNNIPGPASKSFLKGNLPEFFGRYGTEFQKEVALDYGPVVKMRGLLSRPILYISDPKALHHLLIKEETVFEESQRFLSTNQVMFGPGLLSTLGEHHRKQRKMLNPVFSVAHMREMLPIFYNVVHRVRDAIATRVENGQQDIDVLNWMGRTALELIGQGGLGYSFDPLTEDMKDSYGHALKQLLPNLTTIEIIRRLLPLVAGLGPAWFRRRVAEMFPWKPVQRVRRVVDTMHERSMAIYKEKQVALRNGDEAVAKQIGSGKDIMSILMRANMNALQADRLPEEEVIAQMSILSFAATDTTSNTVSRILQLLAEHPDIQEKLRIELISSGAGNGLPYDALNKLPLLDAVCRESLRLYPPVVTVARVPNRDSVLPLLEPIRGIDGKIMTEVHVPKGTEVIIGVLGSNANKARWGEDALEWKPERWLSPLPKAVTDAPIPGVYSNLMSFLGGKRACIGFKFSEMEMKVVLAVLVSSFTFELTDDPIEWNVAGVRYPTIGRESDVPELPLKVSLYKPAII
ncbi:cytochrome P450 [Wolfiporia cocos MD-104 SS10]|uniref:Cytochrome P450 n=1 Tax=Wolfiporia cocos (strain MD-104) TaxID=742152 RepID=A0A2H3JEA5_WOLCO|nr:cytochrome P450 [Wolfiporia cocos MD-104 SS10]